MSFQFELKEFQVWIEKWFSKLWVNSFWKLWIESVYFNRFKMVICLNHSKWNCFESYKLNLWFKDLTSQIEMEIDLGKSVNEPLWNWVNVMN